MDNFVSKVIDLHEDTLSKEIFGYSMCDSCSTDPYCDGYSCSSDPDCDNCGSSENLCSSSDYPCSSDD